MSKIAVIGAGISGLTVAQLLNDKSEVVLFERESKAGGLIKCERINGSLFHTCGGHVFNTKNQAVLDLKRIPLHPRYITHKYNQYTYPIQQKNTREMIALLKQRLGLCGFYMTGRFADWEYYNMDAAIGTAMNLCKCINIESY